MSDQEPAPLHSVEAILAAIQALPEKERLRLFDHMECVRDWQLGRVMVPVAAHDFALKMGRLHVETVRAHRAKFVELANESHRRRKGSRVRAEKTKRRNALIDQAIDCGIAKDKPQALYDFVLKEDPTLLYKSKRSVQPDIDPENMMKVYLRSKNAQDNCNRP